MSINKKTILMVVGIILVLFSLVFVISNIIYLQGFRDLEKTTIEKNVTRVANALSVKLDTLNAFCLDWAEWDDTYYFALNDNEDYITRNLGDETFIDNDISLFLVYNNRGELIYSKDYDIVNEREVPVPADLPDFLFYAVPGDEMVKDTGFQGVTAISRQPVLVTCNPIFPSLDEAPSAGFLVIGRIIDTGLIGFLSETTNLSSGSITILFPGENTELDSTMALLPGINTIYVKTRNHDTISGYRYMNGLNGQPSFILEISIPRDIYNQGTRTIGYLHSSLILIGIVFTGIIIYLIRHLVLSRLIELSSAVNAIGSRGELSNRVQIRGRDELSRLADNINSMLESLEKSETRQNAQKEIIWNILSITPNGVVATDEAGRITIINDAFRNMFNLGNGSMGKVKMADLPGMTEIATEIKNFRLSRMTSFKKDIQDIRQGVNKMYVASFARLKEEELYILYLTDITEERAKQESLYLTDRLASIGEMASGIAHELNNPLTSIIGLSEIVMRDDVPETVKEDMELIKSESHRAANIVRNLLSFARKNATLKQPENINKIVTDVLRLRSYEHGVNNIKIIKELDMELPDIMIDHSQIQQVFINLILNAEYAVVSTHGKGTIKIKTETAENMVKVTITDDGPGIEPDNLRHIFDPFFTTKEVGKGTGLGLSISYGIVTAHNGRIYATSEFGNGATFVIELPLNSTFTKENTSDA